MQIGSFRFSIIQLNFEPVDRDYRFYGSYYRGILGRSLKRRFCLLRNAECDSCPLNDKCLYMLSFERYKNSLFPPYVINRATKDSLRLVLVGSFAEFSEVYLETLSRNFRVKESGYFDPFIGGLIKSKVVLDSENFNSLTSKVGSLNLRLKNVRLKKNSKMASCEQLDLEFILKAIEKRIYLVNKYYGNPEKPVYIPDAKVEGKLTNCKYEKIKRYSNRKKRVMEIPSINLSLKITGEIDKIFPFLALASFLNIGTNASMGFGQVLVD